MSSPFRTLLERSAAGAYVVERGRLSYANPRLAAMFGYERDEMAERTSLADFLVREDVHRLRALLRRALRHGDQSEPLAFRGVRKNGEIVYFEATAAVAEVDGSRAIVGTVVDIGPRVRAERAQHEAEERFALSNRAAGNVIMDWDLASNAVRWSETMYSVFQYSPEEVEDTYDWWWERIHPDDQGRVLTSVKSALNQEGNLWRVEYRFQRGDGSYATVLSRAQIVRLEAGIPVRVVAAMIDLSEHRQLEERYYLSQRMEAIGRLAGGVAHDFNNVLMVVQGTTDLLLMQPDLGESARTDLKGIKKAAERATALTRQLLAFGRRQVLRPEVVDLNVNISEMRGVFRDVLGDNVQLVTHLQAGLRQVRVDPRQLEQVMLNLVTNARESMPEGGQLAIETKDIYLSELDTAKFTYPVLPGKYVRISVQDTGVGMDESTLAQIFEPFFTTKPKGKGLGLSTVYGIVKQSDGYIWVRSKFGVGTSVEIYLPLTASQKAPAQPKPVRTATACAPGTILLVEDEDDVRSVARRILDCGGYRVFEASNGSDALEVCERHGAAIDALITDVVMPEMSGRELATRIVSSYPDVRVLYMSGHTDDRLLQHGLGRQQVNFIQKPFSPNVLLDRVQALLQVGG